MMDSILTIGIKLTVNKFGLPMPSPRSTIEYRYAEGKLDRLPELAAELVRHILPAELSTFGSASATLCTTIRRQPMIFVDTE